MHGPIQFIIKPRSTRQFFISKFKAFTTSARIINSLGRDYSGNIVSRRLWRNAAASVLTSHHFTTTLPPVAIVSPCGVSSVLRHGKCIYVPNAGSVWGRCASVSRSGLIPKDCPNCIRLSFFLLRKIASSAVIYQFIIAGVFQPTLTVWSDIAYCFIAVS